MGPDGGEGRRQGSFGWRELGGLKLRAEQCERADRESWGEHGRHGAARVKAVNKSELD